MKPNENKDTPPSIKSSVDAAIKEAKSITTNVVVARQMLCNEVTDFFESKISPIEFGWKLHEIFGVLKEIEKDSEKHFDSCSSILSSLPTQTTPA